MSVYSTFPSVSGQTLEKAFWPAKGEPKAVVQLVHGMAEHIRRYDETARQLSEAGFAVVGHTHAGHGEHADILGYFGAKGGWDVLIEDVHSLRIETQKQFPDVPYFLLGHSMGSFVVRGYALKYEQGLSGIILSGTGHFDKPTVCSAKLLSQLICLFGGAAKPSPFLAKLTSSGNRPEYKTPFDWLSRDDREVQKYLDDPLCGFPFTAAGYRDMFSGLARLYPEKLDSMKKEIPVYLFSGDQDPVGANGAGVQKVGQELREAGVKEVTVRLYPEGRHEMINELNRQEVWTDLIAWLNAHI